MWVGRNLSLCPWTGGIWGSISLLCVGRIARQRNPWSQQRQERCWWERDWGVPVGRAV